MCYVFILLYSLMKKFSLILILLIPIIFLCWCSLNIFSKDDCPLWEKESRLYHENWSLKQKWCVNKQWLFNGLVSLYNENWWLEAEWYMKDSQAYWWWTYYYENWNVQRGCFNL